FSRDWSSDVCSSDLLARMGDEQRSLSVEGEGNVGGMAARDTVDGGVQILIYNGQNPGGGFRDDTYYAETAASDIGITVSGLDPRSEERRVGKGWPFG